MSDEQKEILIAFMMLKAKEKSESKEDGEIALAASLEMLPDGIAVRFAVDPLIAKLFGDEWCREQAAIMEPVLNRLAGNFTQAVMDLDWNF